MDILKPLVALALIVYAALPFFVAGVRIGLGRALVGVVVSEMFTALDGLGYMVELARTHHRASWSFAGLLVIGGIGLLTDFLIRTISNLLFRWREAT